MIDQSKLTDQLIFQQLAPPPLSHLQHKSIENRQLRWTCEAGAIAIQIIYPLKLKYGFINQVLHHLVTTINKSALISFLVKVDFDSNSPLLLTFYHTMLMPLVQEQLSFLKNTEIDNLFMLPDLIYRKIKIICQGYTIRHCQLVKAYELIEYFTQLSKEIAHFVEQIELISHTLQKKETNLLSDSVFSFEKNDLS